MSDEYFDRGFPSKTIFSYKYEDGQHFEYDYGSASDITLSSPNDNVTFSNLSMRIIYLLNDYYNYIPGLNGSSAKIESDSIIFEKTQKLCKIVKDWYEHCFSGDKQNVVCKFITSDTFNALNEDQRKDISYTHYCEVIVAFMFVYLGVVRPSYNISGTTRYTNPAGSGEVCRFFYNKKELQIPTIFQIEDFHKNVKQIVILMTDPTFCVSSDILNKITTYLNKIGGKKKQRSKRNKKRISTMKKRINR
jgi:hypothetical protein